jgi:hypothetical protein
MSQRRRKNCHKQLLPPFLPISVQVSYHHCSKGVHAVQRISTPLTVLTLLNLGLLTFTLSQRPTTVSADTAPAILRGRGLEIVDASGKLRASISVIPAGPARRLDGSLTDQSGKIYPESVVFRLIRPDGRPSVKIATTEQGSGIDLSGGVDPTYLVLNADGGETSITLTNKDGKPHLLDPDSMPAGKK